MKFTLSWLKDFLDTDASLDSIADTLTAIGLEVESVENPAAALEPFIVARIEEAAPHPNADKLRVCKVNDGGTVAQIVCGAPNARAGIKVALAREGVKIPANGMVIKKNSIRGVESNGMLCSAHELGLSDESEGIIELPESAPLGKSIVGALGLEPLIDIAVTPNRADCLGIYGIARDLAAAGLGTLKAPGKRREARESFASPVSVALETPGCPLFIGCFIKGVRNRPSPEWLQQKLKSVGLRPISALVDVTNFMTIAYGRPLHVFDAGKIKGDITVRDARKGELLKALDGKEYRLESGMVAVCDESGVIGLGGVMGGEATGCDEATTDVFLEAAYFDPAFVAHAGRTLGIESDARYRFERGVDPDFVLAGAEIAIGLILELCGGSASGLTMAGAPPAWERAIAFEPGKVASLGGISLPEGRILDILAALGFSRSGNDITPPSWRADIHGQADLVEEVLRIAGYDTIPAIPLSAPARKATPSPQARRAALFRKTLAARGLVEICSWAFVPQAQAAQFGGGDASLRLLNPINAELDAMRPSLLPGLLAAAARNADRGFADASLFEIGNVFEDATPKGQKSVAAGIHAAKTAARNSFKTEREVDVFDAKDSLFALLDAAGLNAAKLAIDRKIPGWYHPTRAGRISLGGKVTLGFFGELHPLILSSFGLRHRVVAFEAMLDAIPLPRAKGSAKPMLNVSNFQAVERDFAFVGDERLQAADIVKAIESAEKQLIQSVSVFDIYAGKGMEPGKKSMALSVTLQAMDRTLTDQEIEAVSQKIIAAATGLGLSLRQ